MRGPKFRSQNAVPLKPQNRERNFFDEPDDPPKNSVPGLHPLRGTEFFWPPQVRWARERGWLRVQDPSDGAWHEIWAKEAPTGYVRLANAAREERRQRA
jgi:hypothetical protein